MKRRIFITAALTSCFMICYALVADVSGKWAGSVNGPDGQEIKLTYVFKVDGANLTGTAQTQGGTETRIDSGTFSNGTDIKFSITDDSGTVIPHLGKYFSEGDSVGMDINYKGLKFHSTLKRADK